MNRATKIIIATTFTAAAVAAVVKRKAIGGAAVSVATTAREVVQEAKQKVVHIVEAVGGTLSAGTLRRAMQHNIPRLVEQYRGNLPFGVAMAMMERESSFDPTIYNYTGNGCTKNLCVGHWTGPGSRIGGGANGLYQIMSQYIKDYGVPSVDAAFDPETNIRGALKKRARDWDSIVALVGVGPLAFTLAYMAHAEGKGKVDTALAWAKDHGGYAWDVITAAPWISGAAWKKAGYPKAQKPWVIFNSLSGIAKVGKRALLWEAAKPQLLSGTIAGLRMLAALGLVTADGGVPWRWAA